MYWNQIKASLNRLHWKEKNVFCWQKYARLFLWIMQSKSYTSKGVCQFCSALTILSSEFHRTEQSILPFCKVFSSPCRKTKTNNNFLAYQTGRCIILLKLESSSMPSSIIPSTPGIGSENKDAATTLCKKQDESSGKRTECCQGGSLSVGGKNTGIIADEGICSTQHQISCLRIPRRTIFSSRTREILLLPSTSNHSLTSETCWLIFGLLSTAVFGCSACRTFVDSDSLNKVVSFPHLTRYRVSLATDFTLVTFLCTLHHGLFSVRNSFLSWPLLHSPLIASCFLWEVTLFCSFAPSENFQKLHHS